MRFPPGQIHIAVKPAAIVAFTILIAGGLWINWPRRSLAQGPGMSVIETPMTTPWRPKDRNAKYSGPQACVKCHQEESMHQRATAMGRALEPVATSEILRAHPRLMFRTGPYAYEGVRRGDQSFYTVSDGKDTISEHILYTFGKAKHGQTNHFRHNGSFYESHMSFYR